ncbi:MAG: hypothetical protein HWD92_02660 [Flavobacteriia bacterium]|nr:hypothetical protein [Flavobacteriia bacterium]
MKSALFLASVLFAVSLSSFGQVLPPRAGLAQMTIERTMPTAVHGLDKEESKLGWMKVSTSFFYYNPDLEAEFERLQGFFCGAGATVSVEVQKSGTPAQYGEIPSRPNASSWPSPESHAQPINDLRFVDADPAYK